MTRTGQAAIDYARGRVGSKMPEGSGYCLKFVRDCFAVASYYASAIDAWNGSKTQHRGDRNPPPAVPVFFVSPSIYDHVAFAVSPTEIISTYNDDVRRYGSIAEMERVFGGPYLGWTEDINRVTVWTPDSSLAPGEDDFMSYLSYDEQRRVLQAADTWLSWCDSIKTNTDRLPIIHGNSDLTVAATSNITNGVVELLDALHAFEDFLEGLPGNSPLQGYKEHHHRHPRHDEDDES